MIGIEAIGWALLQFVWQGAALGIITAAALAALRRSAADIRYVVAAVGLALMLTLPVVTAVQRWQGMQGVPRDSAAGEVTRHPVPSTVSWIDAVRPAAADARERPAMSSRPDLLAEMVLPALVAIWLLGVVVLSLRLMTSWVRVQRLKTHHVSPVHPRWQSMASRLARQLHITRAIVMLESERVDVPTVAGWLKPVVLLPVSALSGLAPEQLEAILAHELAHVRRHDYLVNLLQTLVETLLFYHPAVWWLSRRIRIEREHCCDDLAVSLCGDPIIYANALADLEALRGPGPEGGRRLAMAADGGSLLHRVRRLLGAPTHTASRPAWLTAGIAAMLLAGIAVSAQNGSAVLAKSDAAARAVPVSEPTPASRPARTAPVVAPAETATVQQAPAAAEGDTTPVPAATDSVEPAPRVAPMAAARAAASQPQERTAISEHLDNSTGSWSWSHNGDKLEVSYTGTFEFTDDDADVRVIAPGATMKISDGAWLGRHSVEITSRGGQIERRYYVNGAERPYKPDGRQWLHANLPKFVRNTGIGAPGRVARFLKAGGPSAVLSEIARVDSTYVKGVYYRELFKQASLSGDQYRQAMTQAGRELQGSDYELASLLIAVADHLPDDDASRAAYFTAASSLSSDYEIRRVYSAMLRRGPVDPRVLSGILTHIANMHSDYDRSELLRQLLAQQPVDDHSRAEVFHAMSSIDSDFERHRMLSAALGEHPSQPTIELALDQASALHNDFETSTFLLEVLKKGSIEGSARAPFFKVAATLDSGYERGRVLRSVVAPTDVSHDTLRAVLESARDLTGHDLSEVLIATASKHPLTGDLRDAYLAAADRLSGYEQGQAMTALVRGERRR